MIESMNKISMLMKAKEFVKALQQMSETDAVLALIEASGQIANHSFNKGSDETKAQIIKFIAENKNNRELALEIALLQPVELKF